MANAIASQVQALYVGYLGRAADQAGLDFWTNAITAGTSTIESVALGFTLSQEYTSKYEGLSNEELAAAIYQNVLGRAADADGLAFWVGELEKGVQTPETLLAAMINSLGAVDQKVIDNKVYVANAYTAAAGADYKAEAGAKILEGVDGTAASVAKAIGTLPTSTETITESLAAVVDAQAAVTADVDAWGAAQTPAKAAGVATVADVHSAVDVAEDAVDDFLVANGVVLTGAGVAATSYDSVASSDLYTAGDAATAYGQQNALEDANLAVIKAKIAAQKTALDTSVSTATTTLQNLTNGAQLKAAVDAVLVAQAGVTAAQKAEANAVAATASSASALVAASDAVTAASFAGTAISVTVDGNTYTSTYNATTKTWTNNDVALNSVNLADVQAKAVAQLAAGAAVDNAEALVSVRMLAVEKLDATQTNGVAITDPATQTDAAPKDGWVDGSVSTALTAEAKAYADAKQAVTDYASKVDGLNKLVAAVDAARSESAELASLEAKVAAANKVLTDAGLNVVSVASGDVEFATAKSDVFQLEATLSGASVKNGAASIYSFADGDVLAVGDKYVLGTATDIQKGNDAVLEVFFTQNGANTDVTIETQAFGDTADANAVSVITLVGVDASALTLENGLIQFA